MKNITINTKNNTIVISKAFEKKASIVGSGEYKVLQTARRDYPDFSVITKVETKKRDAYKGLTFEKMEQYIKEHDDEEKSIMAEFNEMRATTDEAKAMGIASLSYGEIRAWFLEQFPAIEEFYSKRAQKMDAVRESRAAKRAA